MRVISKKRLQKCWRRHREVKKPLLAWYHLAQKENWASPEEVKAAHPAVRIIPGRRAIFKIKGNRYRLVTHINYRERAVYIRFVGTHAEYDRIDAKEI